MRDLPSARAACAAGGKKCQGAGNATGALEARYDLGAFDSLDDDQQNYSAESGHAQLSEQSPGSEPQ